MTDTTIPDHNLSPPDKPERDCVRDCYECEKSEREGCRDYPEHLKRGDYELSHLCWHDCDTCNIKHLCIKEVL